jgi:hypothetical protein
MSLTPVAVVEARAIVDMDEIKIGAETSHPLLQVGPCQKMTKLMPEKLTGGATNQPVSLTTAHPATRGSPARSAANPRSTPPQLCAPQPVSPTLTMEAVEPPAGKAPKRKLGMELATKGYSNKKFKSPLAT